MPRMGFCGDVCDYCPRYIATKSGSVEELKKVSLLWFQAGARAEILPHEQMICHGCSPDKTCQYGITACALRKEVRHCGECDEYPCGIISDRIAKIPSLSEQWKKTCSPEEYELVRRAFFEKKENLERIRR